MTDEPRYRLDDLRRFASALGIAAGISASRAAALATQLAWYEESGFPRSGLETLPNWLERITDRRIDPTAEGVVTGELLGTAALDGQNGLPSLVLARAADLALEKSRDAGIGLVRVSSIASAGPVAAVAAAMVAGPVLGAVLGPGGSVAVALPTVDGPAVFDSALAAEAGVIAGLSSAAGPFEPWLAAMVPDRGTLVVAAAVKTVEPVMTFHERVGTIMKALAEGPGQVIPSAREAHRREVREHGLVVTTEAWARFREWAERLGVALPPSASSAPAIAHAPGGAR